MDAITVDTRNRKRKCPLDELSTITGWLTQCHKELVGIRYNIHGLLVDMMNGKYEVDPDNRSLVFIEIGSQQDVLSSHIFNVIKEIHQTYKALLLLQAEHTSETP